MQCPLIDVTVLQLQFENVGLYVLLIGSSSKCQICSWVLDYFNVEVTESYCSSSRGTVIAAGQGGMVVLLASAGIHRPIETS